jgi:hypothetical protein
LIEQAFLGLEALMCDALTVLHQQPVLFMATPAELCQLRIPAPHPAQLSF